MQKLPHFLYFFFNCSNRSKIGFKRIDKEIDILPIAIGIEFLVVLMENNGNSYYYYYHWNCIREQIAKAIQFPRKSIQESHIDNK